ncbi:MAG: hypothetical protein ACOYXC_21280 [Candidatus Rifleibacteriota bacterium]
MKKVICLALVLFSFVSGAFAQVPDYDEAGWLELSAADQEKVIENLRFEMLHERKADLQNKIDELTSYRAVRTPLTSDNLLKIPLRAGKLEVKALFKKAKGEIRVCNKTRIEAVLDTYRLVAVVDPAKPDKILASFAGDDPNLPAQPVAGTVVSNGKTARITAGADWVELTYEGNNSYSCRTNKVPVKISAKFID